MITRKRLPNSSADDAARDSAILLSIAIQYGADVEMIRAALCRDSQARASGPLGVVLDRLAEQSPPNETETPPSAA
jgi:hypothetical protein